MSESELLDIRAAAAFLGVSQTSLRRWTNSGLLPSFRIGGRRERRFREEDLLAFLKGQSASAAEPVGHFCGFYTSDEGRVRQAVEFLSAGLGKEHVCIVAAAPAVREHVVAALEADHGKAFRRSVIEQVEYLDDLDTQLAEFDSRLREIDSSGATVIRAIGDVSGSRLWPTSNFDQIVDYEVRYDAEVVRRFRASTLCLYDARLLSGIEAHRMLAVHPDTLRYPIRH